MSVVFLVLDLSDLFQDKRAPVCSSTPPVRAGVVKISQCLLIHPSVDFGSVIFLISFLDFGCRVAVMVLLCFRWL
jgi:hypothetical protein